MDSRQPQRNTRPNPNRRPLTPAERNRLRQQRIRKRRRKQITSLLCILLFILLMTVVIAAVSKKKPQEASNSASSSMDSIPAPNESISEETDESDTTSDTGSEPDSLPAPELSGKDLVFELPDASVTAGTSTARIEFSHGPAVNNELHFLVRQQQEEIFDQYDAYAVDLETPAEEKVLYMTFDCGYEYEGRTEACLDILKEKNVPAAFYLVGDFAEMEPELTQRMIDEGHVVGNHSMGHEELTAIDDAAILKTVQDFDNYMKEHFDYNATTFRFPSGVYSEHALALVHSFGYKTYFWSVSYTDWHRDQGIGTEAAMEQLKDRLHPGAYILLHCVSADEPEVLEAFIDYARSEGYTFKPIAE